MGEGAQDGLAGAPVTLALKEILPELPGTLFGESGLILAYGLLTQPRISLPSMAQGGYGRCPALACTPSSSCGSERLPLRGTQVKR